MNIELYSKFPQPEESFLQLMKKASKLFSPALSEVLDLEVYSHKLYTRASFIVCQHEDDIIAFTAFYQNEEAKQLYITLICVDKSFQRQGLGYKMLDSLMSLKADGFETIGLEVLKDNISAYNFYKRNGFMEQEDRREKFLMVKNI